MRIVQTGLRERLIYVVSGIDDVAGTRWRHPVTCVHLALWGRLPGHLFERDTCLTNHSVAANDLVIAFRDLVVPASNHRERGGAGFPGIGVGPGPIVDDAPQSFFAFPNDELTFVDKCLAVRQQVKSPGD